MEKGQTEEQKVGIKATCVSETAVRVEKSGAGDEKGHWREDGGNKLQGKCGLTNVKGNF